MALLTTYLCINLEGEVLTAPDALNKGVAGGEVDTDLVGANGLPIGGAGLSTNTMTFSKDFRAKTHPELSYE